MRMEGVGKEAIVGSVFLVRWLMFFIISTWTPSWKIYIFPFPLTTAEWIGDFQLNRWGVANFLPHFSCFFYVFVLSETDDQLKMFQMYGKHIVLYLYGLLLGLLTLLHHSIKSTNTFVNAAPFFSKCQHFFIFDYLFAPIIMAGKVPQIYWCKRHGSTKILVEFASCTNRGRNTNILQILRFQGLFYFWSTITLVQDG
jgi:hypothetical protein